MASRSGCAHTCPLLTLPVSCLPPAGQLPPELQYTAGVAEDASDLWEQMEASGRPRLPLMAGWLW